MTAGRGRWIRPDADENALRRRGTRQLTLAAVIAVLVISVWFSTAAVVPSLGEAWGISEADASWLTMSVQLGFVAGSVLSALLNLADRIRPARLLVGSSLLASILTLLVALLADGLALAVPLRVATGMALAGVYPVGVKLVTTWFRAGRGLAMGIMIGALSLGSAAPHLVSGLAPLPWQTVLIATGILAFVGACLALQLREGPFKSAQASLRPDYVVEMFRDRAQRNINLGYLGHMWELYAFWTWIPAYISASRIAWRPESVAPAAVGLISFVVIGVAGALGCLIAGVLARRAGSSRVAVWALAVSGVCCALSGIAFGAGPWILLPFLLVWGLSVVADSAQFSAALSDAADPRYVGTALTAQMAIGFLLTVATIWLLPVLAGIVGLQWAFTFLAIGPIVGVIAMRRPAVLRNG